jgi:hypothetical protein
MEPYGPVLPVPKDLEFEERATPSFQLYPFDQLPGINLFGVHLEGIAVRQLTPSLDRVAERLDEPSVARPFPRRYSVMLHVSSDSVVLAASCAAPWFININPVMSVVTRAQAFQWFLLPRQSRPGQTNSDFGTSVVEIIA